MNKEKVRMALDGKTFDSDAIDKLERNFDFLKKETRDLLKLKSQSGVYSKNLLLEISHLAGALLTTAEALEYFANKASKEIN